MFALSSSRKPSYGTAVAEPEVTLADLSEDDLDGAMAEIAEWRGVSLTDVAEQVDILAGGQRDTYSRIVALTELAALDEDTALALAVSTEKRDELADRGKGWAFPDGSWPVHDAKHVGIAKAFLKQGKTGGKSPAAIKAHINRAAARLGIPGVDTDGDDDTEDATDREAERRPRKPRGEPPKRKPVQVRQRGQLHPSSGWSSSAGSPAGYGGGGGGGQDVSGGGPNGGDGAAMTGKRMAVRVGNTYQTVALTDDQADELGLAADRGGPVARIMNRNPEYFVSLASDTPSPFDGPGTREEVGKHFDFEVHEITDEDPTDTQAEKEIARLLKEHGGTGIFGGGGAAYGANQVHRR